jgi:hypothetical protein
VELCLAAMFILFIGLEVVLKSGLVPILSSLSARYFEPFLDERDQGAIVYSHTYLLFGISTSIWFQ